MTYLTTKKIRHFRLTDEEFKKLERIDPTKRGNATSGLVYLINKEPLNDGTAQTLERLITITKEENNG